MAGYEDPFSGVFNWPTMIYFAWAGFILFIMLMIFIGFDAGGFLHRLEERFGMRNVDRDPRDDERA